MTPQDLKTGDLIFFCNSLGYIEHIALFANYKDSIPYIIHAITAPYYSVMLTSLRKPDEGCHYLVMRPKQAEIALIATGILYRWVELQVPFASSEKRNNIVDTLDILGGFDCPSAGMVQEPYGKKTYLENFRQYIQIANSLPFVPSIDGKAEGMFCSETIISAFNVAGLISDLRALELMSLPLWSIDTYAAICHFAEAFDSPLPFDAKATLPAGIYEHCLKDTTHWSNMAILDVNFELEDEIAKGKGVWLEFKHHLLTDASEKVRACLASPVNTPIRLEGSPKVDSPRKNLLLFAPIGAIPQDSRSSPMRFLDEFS